MSPGLLCRTYTYVYNDGVIHLVVAHTSHMSFSGLLIDRLQSCIALHIDGSADASSFFILATIALHIERVLSLKLVYEQDT